jgi:hypothetical protein
MYRNENVLTVQQQMDAQLPSDYLNGTRQASGGFKSTIESQTLRRECSAELMMWFVQSAPISLACS